MAAICQEYFGRRRLSIKEAWQGLTSLFVRLDLHDKDCNQALLLLVTTAFKLISRIFDHRTFLSALNTV